MADSNERLREARKVAGFRSARSAALRHHWTPSTYASHENGQTPVPPDAAKAYAKAFRVSQAWLLTGEGDRRPPRLVELAGQVGAGGDIEPLPESAPIDHVDGPPGAPANIEAVIVRGTSMYPRYFEGEHLFYQKAKKRPEDLIGRECVVQLADGRMLVKIIRRGSKRHLFNLESWNAPTLEDQKVDWAAPVRWRG
jgi:phage repressor protein C with HTH and peptisase S24 domain